MLEVGPADSCMLISPDSLVEAAEAAAGRELVCAIRLEPGMQRYLEMSLDYQGARPAFREFEVVSTRRTGPRNADPVSYDFEQGSVLLGLSVSDAGTESWEALALHSFWVDPDGSLQYLQEHRAGGAYSPGVYILDLTGDGVLEVAMPWATGVAAGGAVDVLAIVPTGGLAYFGSGEDYSSSYYSQWGELNLLDYDSDGDWELELFYPVFHPNTGFSGANLLQFSWDDWEWLLAGSEWPEYYAPQYEFYASLLDHLHRMEQDPGSYLASAPGEPVEYACEIGGGQVSLTMFFDPVRGGVDQLFLEQLERQTEYLAELAVATNP